MRRTASILLLALAPAVAWSASLEKWDENGDGALGLDEFGAVMRDAGWIAEWNRDGDDAIAFDEFRTSLFAQFDDDGDGSLSRQEWEEGFRDWPGNLDWSGWDEDGDGSLSQAEFAEGVGARGLYAAFAGQDMTLQRSEFVEGIFDWYEGPDGDRLLGPDEAAPLFRLIAGDH